MVGKVELAAVIMAYDTSMSEYKLFQFGVYDSFCWSKQLSFKIIFISTNGKLITMCPKVRNNFFKNDKIITRDEKIKESNLPLLSVTLSKIPAINVALKSIWIIHVFGSFWNNDTSNFKTGDYAHTYTHARTTHTHPSRSIYNYLYMCVCVCMYACKERRNNVCLLNRYFECLLNVSLQNNYILLFHIFCLIVSVFYVGINPYYIYC